MTFIGSKSVSYLILHFAGHLRDSSTAPDYMKQQIREACITLDADTIQNSLIS